MCALESVGVFAMSLIWDALVYFLLFVFALQIVQRDALARRIRPFLKFAFVSDLLWDVLTSFVFVFPHSAEGALCCAGSSVF